MTASSLPLVEISSGDPRERGRQHGEIAREQIAKSIEFYRQAFERSSKLSWPEIQQQSQLWVPVIDEYLPGIIEEVKGIAEGSGRNFGEILALNGRTELGLGNPFLDESKDGCSTYVVLPEAAGDGHVYCGQNWDFRPELGETVIMMRIVQPPKPTIVMQVEAGQVARQGANSRGVAVNGNGLGLTFGNRVGVPLPYLRRKVLNSVDMHDALHAMIFSSQAACSNFLIVHREGVAVDLETTPGRFGWMYPKDGVMAHANAFLSFVPEQVADSYRPRHLVDSLYRVPRIEKALREARNAATSAEVRAVIGRALTDHFSAPNSVCRHVDERDHPLERYETIASSIVDLTTGEYWVSIGPPCEHGYQKLPWNLYE